jgi:hypothetical protein
VAGRAAAKRKTSGKKKQGRNPGGRPSKYRDDYPEQARKLFDRGFTDLEVADQFGVGRTTLYRWQIEHPEFRNALKAGKELADDRVVNSLYHRATGYTYDAVKIFMPAGAKKPVIVPYREHVPPDSTSMIFWLKNRRPEEFRNNPEPGGDDPAPEKVTVTVEDASKPDAEA